MKQRSVPIITRKAITGIIILFSLAACQEQIDPRVALPAGPGPDPDSPLIGTAWLWDGGWGAVNLYFESAERVIFNGQESYEYSYDKAAGKGQAVSLGNFAVTENYSRLIFSPTWRGYPHGADFTRTD